MRVIVPISENFYKEEMSLNNVMCLEQWNLWKYSKEQIKIWE